MDTWLKSHAIHDTLIEAAKCRETITYTDAGRAAGLGARSPVLYSILDRINMEEHHAGRPLLSAVVVNQQEGIPGIGFFHLANSLGHYRESDSKKAYWQWELRRVYEEWARPGRGQS